MTMPIDPSKPPWAQGPADQLLDDYLLRLGHAARKLPFWQRQLFLDDVADQIDDELKAGGAVDPERMRAVLAQLGEPRMLVQADNIAPDWPGGQELAAVLVLLVGGVVLPVVGWLVGIVLLWASPRWRPAEKWLGTLVWPGGLLAFAATIWITVASDHSNTLPAGNAFFGGLVLGILTGVPPVVVAIRLLHAARRPARRLAGRREPAASQTVAG